MAAQIIQGTGSSPLSALLRRFLQLIPDARQITMSTADGAELLTEGRAALTTEDAHTVASLAPSFATSVEQSSRLGLGASQYAIVWVANSIILQTKVESLIISILMDQNANLGLAEEHVVSLRSLLKPFCSF
jgi:predicted regulator of Ras-like GTPase activity (Roadblock/LC7/MglB family)